MSSPSSESGESASIKEFCELEPSRRTVEHLLRYELAQPVDEDGQGKVSVKKSLFPGGGLG